jgi:hypothetical protein
MDAVRPSTTHAHVAGSTSWLPWHPLPPPTPELALTHTPSCLRATLSFTTPDAYLPVALASMGWAPGLIMLLMGIAGERLPPLSHLPASWAAAASVDCWRSPLCGHLPPAVTWYASLLLSSLYMHNGVHYIRYSDLGTSISGR